MKSTFHLLAFSMAVLCSSSVLSAPTPADDASNQRLVLDIIRHQPCTNKIHSNELIRFPSIDKAPLVPDPDHPGCYIATGTVPVRKDLKGSLQTYVQIRTGSKSPIEKCVKADSDGCGGVGSCVYCGVCASVQEAQKKTSASIAVLENGKAIDCENGLKAGNHTNIQIRICPPTKPEFLDVEGIDEEAWNQNGEGGHTVFVTVYIFNKPVNKLSNTELQKIATDDSDQTIGCHRFVGTISDPQS